MKKRFLSFIAVAALGCACAFAQGTTGTTTTTTTTNYVFPPLGLAPTETAAVSLVNIAPAPSSATATAPSCTGTVTFANSAGKTIGTPTAFTVGSGQIATVSLPFNSSGFSAANVHNALLASVQQTTTRPSAAACALVFSLQTFDTTTGVTHLFLGNEAATTPPPAPSPSPVR